MSYKFERKILMKHLNKKKIYYLYR